MSDAYTCETCCTFHKIVPHIRYTLKRKLVSHIHARRGRRSARRHLCASENIEKRFLNKCRGGVCQNLIKSINNVGLMTNNVDLMTNKVGLVTCKSEIFLVYPKGDHYTARVNFFRSST